MQDAHPNLLTCDDTLFGVCEALGQDFGFNPNWLRAALAAPLILNPVAVLVAYAALGMLVALSRRLYPRSPAMKAGSGRQSARVPRSRK